MEYQCLATDCDNALIIGCSAHASRDGVQPPSAIVSCLEPITGLTNERSNGGVINFSLTRIITLS